MDFKPIPPDFVYLLF